MTSESRMATKPSSSQQQPNLKRHRFEEHIQHSDDNGVTFSPTSHYPSSINTSQYETSKPGGHERSRTVSEGRESGGVIRDASLQNAYSTSGAHSTATPNHTRYSPPIGPYSYPPHTSRLPSLPKTNSFLADASLFDDLFNNLEEFPLMTPETRTDREHHSILTHGLSSFLNNKHFCDLVLVAKKRNPLRSSEPDVRELVHAVIVSSVSRTIASMIAAKQKSKLKWTEKNDELSKAQQKNTSGDRTKQKVTSIDVKSEHPTKKNQTSSQSEPTSGATSSSQSTADPLTLYLDPTFVDGDVLPDVIKYVYTGAVDVGINNSFAMLSAACYLRLSGLALLCCDALKESLSATNVLSVLQISQLHSRRELEFASLEYIDYNFSQVASHSSWIEATSETLERIIARDSMCVSSEIEVFRALVCWATHDQSRTGTFEEMLVNPTMIRLPNMSRNDLIEVSQHQLVESSELLRTTLYNEAIRRVQNGPAPAGTALRRYGVSDAIGAQSGGPYANYSSRGGGTSGISKVPERTLVGHLKAVCALTLFENYLISGSSDGEIWAWDTFTWECTRRLLGHTNSVVSLKVVGHYLVSGSPDQTIRVWNLLTWELSQELKSGSSVCALAVCGDSVCSGSDDGKIMVWDTTVWRGTAIVKAHSHVIWALVDCGGLLVSGSSDSKIKVWDPSSWQCQATLARHQDEVQALVVAGDMLVSGSDDGVINIWDRHTWALLRTLEGNKHAILTLAVWGNSLIAGLGNGEIRLWDVDTMTESTTLTDHSSCVMAIITCGNRLMSASYDKSIKVWALK